MAKMGRPQIEFDDVKLKELMRLYPSLEDTAAFFECHPDTINNYLKRRFEMTFSEFREQNMVHSKFMLVRTALYEAEKGNTAMLIFCLKNICKWRDKPVEDDEFSKMSTQQLIALVKEKT